MLCFAQAELDVSRGLSGERLRLFHYISSGAIVKIVEFPPLAGGESLIVMHEGCIRPFPKLLALPLWMISWHFEVKGNF